MAPQRDEIFKQKVNDCVQHIILQKFTNFHAIRLCQNICNEIEWPRFCATLYLLRVREQAYCSLSVTAMYFCYWLVEEFDKPETITFSSTNPLLASKAQIARIKNDNNSKTFFSIWNRECWIGMAWLWVWLVRKVSSENSDWWLLMVCFVRCLEVYMTKGRFPLPEFTGRELG